MSVAKPAGGTTLLVALVAACVLSACEGSFEPGKMVRYENPEIGFALTVPDNLEQQVEGDTVTFQAKGFPSIRVSLEKTDNTSARGSGGSSGMGKVKWEVVAPLRKLSCRCEDVGDHKDLIQTICKSLENTKDAPKNPHVQFEDPEVEGTLEDEDAYLKGLAGLHEGITKCWKDAVAADADFPSGDLNFMVTFAPGGDAKSTSISRTFNYPKHEPLTDCVKKLFFGVQPQPKDTDVEVQWYLRFKLY